MRLQHEKKALLYLTPEKERVGVMIVLGGYACGLAMAGSLPAAIKPDSQDCEGSRDAQFVRPSRFRGLQYWNLQSKVLAISMNIAEKLPGFR